MVGRSPSRSYALVFARAFAPFFAAALRFAALRLRVFAAFLAAALRFAGPPVARSSISLASARRSLATFLTPFGVFRFARPVASASERATRLRSPRARSVSNSSSCLDFLAIGSSSVVAAVEFLFPAQRLFQARDAFWKNRSVAGRARRTGAAALASAGAASFGLWHRLFRQPLPQTRGAVAVRGLESNVTISRDRFGVPRIEARSSTDLCFGHGFCLGQDRLWQLEFYRRVASGRMSEFAGREGLKIDRLMRTLGLKRVADAEVATIPARGRMFFDAYARGINAAIEAAPALPFELQVLRIDPEPWTVADSLAVGKVVALGFSTNMEQELFRAELVSLIGAEKVARLEPQYPGGHPVVTQPGAPWAGGGLELAAQIAEVRAAVGLSLATAGSNNWVVSGERSETGMPLLANDPHISATIPDVWYTVELSTPDIEMRGGSLPGTPGLVIGQNPYVAWGLTNVMADVQDLYVERVRSAHDGQAPQYEFEGELRAVKVTHERIGVRGQHPEPLEIWETHHGPIVNRALRAASSEPLALAWTALREP